MFRSVVAWRVKKKVFRIQSYFKPKVFNKNQGTPPPDRRWILMKLIQLEFFEDQKLRIEDVHFLYRIIYLAKFRHIEFINSQKFYKYLDPTIVEKVWREKMFFDPIFKPKPRNNGGSRFSDGSFPVFYSSLEKETAKAESCYLYNELRGRNKPFRRVLFSCQFSGNVKDFQASTCPKFKQNRDQADGYAFCQELGKQDSGDRLYGLLVPSARNLGGVNLPVFSRYALSNPCLENYSNRSKENYFNISCPPKKNRRMPKK